MKNDKINLRKKYIEIRNNIGEDERNILSEKAAEIFIAKVKKFDAIALYYPIHNEINPLPIIDVLVDKKVSLPVINGKMLDFFEWDGEEGLLRNNTLPVYEPRSRKNKILPDVIIVPMVAFDRKKHRLGYGGGYYDRTIEYLRKQKHRFITIGYAYSNQEADLIPVEKHDAVMDYIITDKEVVR